MDNNVEYEIEFYEKENGRVPVLELLLSLKPKMRAKAFSEVELLQKHGPALREPYVKSLKGKNNKDLYELRVKFASDITRIFYFCYKNNKYVLLNGFVKKTQKTPENEIDRARRYRDDYERRCDDE